MIHSTVEDIDGQSSDNESSSLRLRSELEYENASGRSRCPCSSDCRGGDLKSHCSVDAMQLIRTLALVGAVAIASRAAAQTGEPQITVDVATGAPTVIDLPSSAFKNANGSPRLRDDQYRVVRRRIVPLLERWSRDRRLAINPAYVTALMLKESGGDSLAVSGAAALGLAQLTASADSDMRLMVTEYHFQWMAPEVNRWPRSAAMRAPSASAAQIDSLLARGAVSARSEYLFDPVTSARAAVFWIRLLENKWTTDFWPGGYGPSVRQRLNGGEPLTQHQMFDLVTVSYNRGYIEVKALVDKYGADWVEHLGDLTGAQAEAADYLERVRAYTALLQTTGDPAPSR
jgi:hypothetical protein